MDKLNYDKEELINEINNLKMQINELKQELDFYKDDNNIKEKYKLDLGPLKEILEAMPTAVVIVDAKEGKFSYLNKRALAIYGMSYVGFDLDSHISMVKALKLDGKPYPLDEMPVSYSLKYAQEVRNKDMIIERVDGKQIPFRVSSSPIFDDKGTVTSAIVIFEDVTKFKKVEKSLRDSEAMMKTILENSFDGIYLLDLKTEKFLYLSPSQVEYIGFNKEEINNMTVEEVYERIHPDDFEINLENYKLLTAGIETQRKVEYRWRVKSGEYHWFSDRRKLVRDENGQPVAIVGIARDITERKEYEEKLASQAKILSNVSDAIIALDENDRITYCNKTFLRLFGWQEQELIGNQFYDIAQSHVDVESKEKILWKPEERKKDYNTYCEKGTDAIKCYTKYENQIVININRSEVRDSKGEFKSLIVSIRDVSEHYEYELKLKKSEEKYRYLYNSIDEGFAILDVIFDKENKPEDIRIIELNPSCEKFSGIKNKDVLGKTAKELKFDIKDFWNETYGEVALTGEPIRFVNESKFLNLWIDAYVFKMDLEKGNRIGVIFSDITENVMHNRKMEELIKMQDELYANVSHELRTPLNVIFSANQLIDIYLKGNLTKSKKDKLIAYNDSIKQNCYRLTKLINNIVDLSKSNSGLLTINLINANIVKVVEGIVQSISEFAKSKELKIIFNTNVEEKFIAVDPDKIERIMLNLISNAIKFSYPKSEICVNMLIKDDKVEIYVKDNGIGINKQNLDNIFKRFYQEDKSLSRNAEGSGIGLSLIKKLVELHGGNISVESEINKGSIFKVELPSRTIESEETIEQTNSLNNKIEKIRIEFSDIYSI